MSINSINLKHISAKDFYSKISKNVKQIEM